MKVSIVTVCFNSGKTIERTIKSVLEQKYPDIEYIVIDGASTDNTMDIVTKYERLFHGRMRWVSEPDSGIYDAMNKGVLLASGELIGILNSDDYFFENTVELIVEAATREKEAGVFHGNMLFESQSGIPVLLKSKNDLNVSHLYFMNVNHSTMFVRNNIYEKHGVYDTNYRIVADYELVVRYITSGVKFYYINEVLAYMHAGGASTFIDSKDLTDMKYIILKNKLPFVVLLRWYFIYMNFIVRSSIKKMYGVEMVLPAYRTIRDMVKSNIDAGPKNR